jgi:DNA-binding NarL/FixJ family response regulator
MPPVLALVNDLFFYSKIRQTAQQLGRQLEPAQPETISAKLRESAAETLVLELGSGLEEALDAVRALKSDAELAKVRVVAFGSHVQVSMLQAAREAGCDEVLSRSEFTARLPELLGG